MQILRKRVTYFKLLSFNFGQAKKKLINNLARLRYPVPDSPVLLSNINRNYIFIVNVIVVLYVNQRYRKRYENLLFHDLWLGNTFSRLETEKLFWNVKS